MAHALPEYIEAETGAAPQHCVIWLHGLGADGRDFADLPGMLNLPAQMAIRFLFPHARMRPITLNGGMMMRGWYDLTSLDANKKEDLDEYVTKIPKNITIVPKIESSIGVDNIESITNKLEYKERIIMLDHDDLYTDLLKLNIPTEKFSYYMNKLIDFCKTNNILLLRTVGIIFTNEDKNISDYIR